MKKFLILILAVCFILGCTIYWSGHNYLQIHSSGLVEKLPPMSMTADSQEQKLKVMSWNIGFFYGLGSDGTGYVSKEQAFYQERLEKAAALIKEHKIDLVFLQEIDFKAQRTHFQDQLKELALKAELPYIAYAYSWSANYVPYPYFPIKNHFGPTQSGGALISRYPIKENKVYLLPKPKSKPFWYNHLYPYRYGQLVTITIKERELTVLNTHLEAFDKENRALQVRELISWIKKDKVKIWAGDFNTIPDQAKKRTHFLGYPEDDYQEDQTFKSVLSFGLKPSNLNYNTFPAHRPDRKLDYIFFDEGTFSLDHYQVLNTQESDHRPVISILNFNN